MADTKSTEIVYKQPVIDLIVKEGNRAILDSRALEAINILLDMEDRIKQAKTALKKALIEAGNRIIGPDFHGVVGDTVKIYKRFTDKYTAEKTSKANLREFMKTVTFQKLDSDKVEEYRTKTGKLPSGVFEKDESETLIIARKK